MQKGLNVFGVEKQTLSRLFLVVVCSLCSTCNSSDCVQEEEPNHYDFSPQDGVLFSTSDDDPASDRVAVQLNNQLMRFKIWSSSDQNQQLALPLEGNYQVIGRNIHFDFSVFGEAVGRFADEGEISFTSGGKRYLLKRRNSEVLLSPFELQD